MGEALIPSSNSKPILEKLTNAFLGWVVTNYDYNIAKQAGVRLERLMRYVPSKIKRSPVNTLYRAIIIKESLLNKVLKKNKYFILKNRKYSSWTYDLKAAKRFAEDFLMSKDYCFVILRKTFKPDEMIVNIPELRRYLYHEKMLEGNDYSYVYREKEIIVKIAGNDHRFTIDNIELYETKDSKGWQKPSAER